VKSLAIRGEPNVLPPGMPAERQANVDGFRGIQRVCKDGRIAEQAVEFEKDELGNCHILAVIQRAEVGNGRWSFLVARRDGGQQNVGIDRDHLRRSPRFDSSSAANFLNWASGTLMPPAFTRGSCHS